jgi:hypothetical protein
MGLGLKQPVFRKSISYPSFHPTGVWYTIFKTLGLGLKSLGCRILNFGVGPEISGSEWADTHQKINFLFGIWHFDIR